MFPQRYGANTFKVICFLNDPWGHPNVYRCPGLHNTITFDVYSWGPDGKSKSGGEDPGEIGNWEPAPEVVTTGHWGTIRHR